MKFHGGNQLLQKHSGWFTIFELWIGRRVISINFYPQHLCCTKSGTKDTNFWHERAGKWEFKFYDENVVAWMPLPKAPEETK